MLTLSQISKTYSKKTITEMKRHYDIYKINPPPGAIFRAKTAYATITAYQSGKVLFQGKQPLIESEKWESQYHTEQKKLFPPNKNVDTSYYPPKSLFLNNHIGSDESGTGDYFGPITTCAMFVKKEQIDTLKELGIQDSKAIRDDTIHTLAKELVRLQIPYSLMILPNAKYNTLQKQGWSQGKMKAMLHYHTIQKLLQKINDETYEGIIIDQFCQPSLFEKYIQSEHGSLHNHTFFMTKAESYSIAVAAASVIARASFLKEMERLSNEVGVPLLKGASAKVDQLIAHIIKTKGKNVLQNIAKVHFANTEKAAQYM